MPSSDSRHSCQYLSCFWCLAEGKTACLPTAGTGDRLGHQLLFLASTSRIRRHGRRFCRGRPACRMQRCPSSGTDPLTVLLCIQRRQRHWRRRPSCLRTWSSSSWSGRATSKRSARHEASSSCRAALSATVALPAGRYGWRGSRSSVAGLCPTGLAWPGCIPWLTSRQLISTACSPGAGGCPGCPGCPDSASECPGGRAPGQGAEQHPAAPAEGNAMIVCS